MRGREMAEIIVDAVMINGGCFIRRRSGRAEITGGMLIVSRYVVLSSRFRGKFSINIKYFAAIFGMKQR